VGEAMINKLGERLGDGRLGERLDARLHERSKRLCERLDKQRLTGCC